MTFGAMFGSGEANDIFVHILNSQYFLLLTFNYSSADCN